MFPRVSVVVPIYKVEKYISRCIESIINQSYKNLEIILLLFMRILVMPKLYSFR